MKPIKKLLLCSALAAAALSFGPAARANVYATNIKLNGALTNTTTVQGSGLSISYILNEPATLGATVKILSGATVIRTISLASGSPGTLKGLNTVAWDGKNGSGSTVTSGTYNISVTAGASGFTSWTQTSTDTNAGYYVFSPRGLAVNNNPASPFYGRVFVGNAKNNATGTAPGDVDGILKLNADGSLADEAQSSGGYAWIDDGFNDSPHMLRYGQDDRIYGLDWVNAGEIIACDMIMSTNQKVLSSASYASNPYSASGNWGTMEVTDAGTTNGLLWLGDNNFPSAGVWAWHMTNGVADPNDPVGTQVIATGGDLSLLPSGDFMMDANSNVFVSQFRGNAGDVSQRTMVFTNWDRTTTMTTGTAWQVGSADDTMRRVYDTVLDNRNNPTYVALPMGGASGGIRVLYATNGLVVTNASGSQILTNLDAPNFYFGAAFDAVGNLYGASSTIQKWRVFSPPGTNQATTVSLQSVQVVPVPQFTSITVSGSTVTLKFTDAGNPAPTAYTLLKSGNVSGPYVTVAGAVFTQTGPGSYQATTTTSGSALFFRITR